MSAPTIELLDHVEESIRSRRLLRDRQHVLVSVSGGLDSVVLLHLLHTLAARHHWSLVVAHFNHQLRGAASDADERFVKLLARKLRLTFLCERWPKQEQQQAKALGLEMAARLARHTFLARAALSKRCPTVALAHHADDQVELFFLRLLRGASGDGLRGMKWSGPAWAGTGFTLVRPLLDVSRVSLSAFAKRHGVRHREDASNADRDRDRNWIRHELLPSLAHRFGHAPGTTVLRCMELVGTDADFVQCAATQWLKSRRKGFPKLHPAVQRQALVQQLRRLGVAVGFDLVERLRLRPEEPVAAEGARLVWRDTKGRVLLREAAPVDFDSSESRLAVGSAGNASFGGVAIHWRHWPDGTNPPRTRRDGREFFDAAKVGFVVRLRHWRPGDRFQPIGMGSSTKLQDLFTNLKIPAARRRELLVAEAANGELFWVEGVRIGEQFKRTAETRIVLEWRWGGTRGKSPVRSTRRSSGSSRRAEGR